MKDKLEPNMYVRTKRGTFDRFMTSKKIESLTWYTFEDRGSITNPENYIINASHNIIDLIEVGDYVNGYLVLNVLDFNDNTRILSLERIYDNKITEEDIKSIVTKEQFSSMEYRLGDDK